MATVTVSPDNLSVTVSGTQPIGTATGDLRGSYPAPYIDAEAYNRRSYVLFSDFCNTAAPWSIVTAASATSSFTHVYDGSTINYLRLATANSVGGSRAWVSDRSSVGVQPQILAGNAEMIISARVRFNRNSDANTSARFGFIQGHQEPFDNPIGDGNTNAIYFYAFKSNSWVACSLLDYDPGQEPPTGDGQEFNTGISCLDWHTLKVTVNAAGTECKFYIDGALQLTVTDPAHIPKVGNVTQTQAQWMHAGLLIRADATGSSASPTVDIDWMHYEYRIAR